MLLAAALPALSSVAETAPLRTFHCDQTGCRWGTTARTSTTEFSCRQGGCQWFRVLSKETVLKGPRGRLLRLSEQRNRDRVVDGKKPTAFSAPATTYVICSKELPGYISKD